MTDVAMVTADVATEILGKDVVTDVTSMETPSVVRRPDVLAEDKV